MTSQYAIRMALGILPDAETAVLLCETLLDKGCDDHRILLLSTTPAAELFAYSDRFPLLELDHIQLPNASHTVLLPAATTQRTDLFDGTIERAKNRIVLAAETIYNFIDSGAEMAWSFYSHSIMLGKIVVALRLDGLEQETMFTKLILANSVDRFETINLEI